MNGALGCNMPNGTYIGPSACYTAFMTADMHLWCQALDSSSQVQNYNLASACECKNVIFQQDVGILCDDD